ncbi:hypothetical protein, partial [Bacillus safensis]
IKAGGEKMEDIMRSVKWRSIDKNTNSIFVIDENSTVDITEEFKKEELLLTDSFVRYSINPYNDMGSVDYYEISKKVLSPKGNLLIFAERTTIQL